MKTITLPNHKSRINYSFPIEVYNYRSNVEISKQQVILHKNTFSFLQEGTKEVYFNNSSHSITDSQFLLMKSGNCLMTEKLSDIQKNYSSILFFFTNEDVLEFIMKYKIHQTINTPSPSTYSFNYDPFIKGFVKSLLEISKLPESIQKKLLVVKFHEIMLYLTELNGLSFLFSLIKNSDDKTQKFIKTIKNNRLNRLSIDELSFLCNMSNSTFKREFNKHFSSSPSKWFQDQRLEHAAFLLKNEKKRVSDIFEEIGYDNLSSFIQAFKIKFGMTPKQFQTN